MTCQVTIQGGSLLFTKQLRLSRTPQCWILSDTLLHDNIIKFLLGYRDGLDKSVCLSGLFRVFRMNENDIYLFFGTFYKENKKIKNSKSSS